MKKALQPLLWILATVIILAMAGYMYDQKFGADGPFESRHHGSADDGHDHGTQGVPDHEGHDQ